MKKTALIFIIGLLMTSSLVVAQNITSYENITPNVIPPTPQAYNFTKIAEIPVNESSGNATVSIPLFTFEAGKIKIPLNISHGGGALKVDDDNSWTGISWQLSAGGLITRTVNDQPDEKMGTNERLHHESSSITQQNLSSIAISSYDSEVDIFNYNFLGYSGSFYFQKELVDNKLVARQIKYEGELKIEMSADAIQNNIIKPNLRTITITTPDGSKYFFGGTLASQSTKLRILNSPTISAQTAFYLFKIENTLGDIVTFNYESDATGSVRTIGYEQEMVKTLNINDPSIQCAPTINTSPILGPPKNYYLETSSYLTLKNITYNKNLSSISFTTLDNSGNIVGNRLSEILYYNCFGKLENKISFDYVIPDVVGTSNNVPSLYTNVSHKRFFLETIKIFNRNTNAEEVYSFEYNQINLLPKRFSFSQDYAGYYNGALTNQSYVPNIPTFFNSAPIQNSLLANRDVSAIHTQYGSLKKVKYPTKGVIEFFYESGISNLSNFSLHSSPNSVYSKPGIRIKEIHRYDNQTASPMKTRYYYRPAATALSSNEPDSEIQVRQPNFTGKRRFVGSCEIGTCYPFTIEKLIIYSKIQNNIYMSDFNRNSYRYVTVSYGGDNFENGGKQSEYFVQADLPANPYGSMSVEYSTDTKATNNSVRNGTLLNEIIFKNGSTFNNSNNEIISGKVKEITNTYNPLEEKSSRINNWSATKFCEKPICLIGNYDNYTDNYFISNYYVYSLWHVLSKTVTKEYLSNGTIETIKNYNYENSVKLAGLPSSVSTTIGSDSSETKYYYPPDNQLALEPFRDLLVSKYIISTPLKIEELKNSIKISEQKTIYGNDSSTANNLLPKYIYVGKFPSYIIPELEKKVTYKYDSNGNIIEYQLENGIPISIIWGYNLTRPVAKLENVLYSNIPLSLITSIQNETNNISSTNSQITANLNLLRTTFTNCMVTTLTYNSFNLNISSVTDPKGDKTFYTYDSSNRLKFIVDKEGNILSENEYHFKP